MTRSFKLAWINYWCWLQHDKDYIRLHTQLLLAALRWQQQQDPPISPARGRPGGSGTVAQQHQQRDDLRATRSAL